MAGIVAAEANRLLDASFGKVAYVAPTTPMRLALATTANTDSAAGTEVTGGSYARQDLDMGTAANKQIPNSATEAFTNMPAGAVSHIDIYDAAATPRRAWYGTLTTARTLAAGDTLSFAAAAIAASLGV